MFKVLIAEDERRTARSIAQLVNEHPRFQAAVVAANGAEALEAMEKTPVDLVITDIRMPGMDGMQLLAALHRDTPDCLTVVLSGYSEFAYARSAIQNGAFNYLLKPVDQDELFQMLDQADAVLTKRQDAALKVQLRRALDGEPTREERLVWPFLLHRKRTADMPPDAAWLWFSGTEEREEILIALTEPRDVETLLHRMERQSSTPVQLIGGKEPVRMAELHQAVKQLRMQLAQRTRLFCSDYFLVDLRQPLSIREGRTLKELQPDRAVEAICAQDRKELRLCLDQLLRSSQRQLDVQNYLSTVLLNTRLAYGLTPGRVEERQAAMRQIVAEATDRETCVTQLTEQLLHLQSGSGSKRALTDLADDVAWYLQANYHLPLTVESLAKQYGVGPRHLNKVFKERTGLRPSEYLLKLRMEQARRILEAKPEALIKDVAINVGYSDPLYFSRIFKKETGSWPSEFQQEKTE